MPLVALAAKRLCFSAQLQPLLKSEPALRAPSPWLHRDGEGVPSQEVVSSPAAPTLGTGRVLKPPDSQRGCCTLEPGLGLSDNQRHCSLQVSAAQASWAQFQNPSRALGLPRSLAQGPGCAQAGSQAPGAPGRVPNARCGGCTRCCRAPPGRAAAEAPCCSKPTGLLTTSAGTTAA